MYVEGSATKKAVEFFLICRLVFDLSLIQDVKYRLTQNIELGRNHCPSTSRFRQPPLSFQCNVCSQSASYQTESPGSSLLLLINLDPKANAGTSETVRYFPPHSCHFARCLQMGKLFPLSAVLVIVPTLLSSIDETVAD